MTAEARLAPYYCERCQATHPCWLPDAVPDGLGGLAIWPHPVPEAAPEPPPNPASKRPPATGPRLFEEGGR